MKRYTLSRRALEDVSFILAYFDEYSETSARRFEAELTQELIGLGTLPVRYRYDPEIVAPPVRLRIFRGYRIYYNAETTAVTILRIVHGSRDLSAVREGFFLND